MPIALAAVAVVSTSQKLWFGISLRSECVEETFDTALVTRVPVIGIFPRAGYHGPTMLMFLENLAVGPGKDG